ncbi:uncharacterized protein (TIGR02271 family) [Bacillus ectoiniformans]|uniref:YsnF/AvaK domain-containing protein n=1 Tax=Bacillus ectoiniformans TaxID=1494429 RepID=UPI00195B6CCC|nr:YsnF/AvaK domain-containing protein [Bacillus ectoiniformans]MBM7649892.1 uncharacterized protein (TIGR02271 family) [Bacillus ectoiniformans]
MNNDKKFIGVFNNQTEVIRKIDELKAEGYDASDIYAVAKDKDNISMVRGRTGAEVESAAHEASWMDKFMAFLSGEDEVRGGLNHMGLSDADSDRYYRDIETGKILLYVDKDYYDNNYRDRTLTNAADPNLGPDAFGTDSDLRATDRAVEGVRADRVTDLDEDLTDEQRIQLSEERLEVDKERVQTGEVYVEKDVVEEERKVDVTVERDEVYVERRPVNESTLADDGTPIIEDDDSIRIPVTEERVEVTKKPVVTEEIVVGKRKVQDTETVHDTVKREEADVRGADELDKADRDLDDTLLDRDDNLDRRNRF